MAVKTNGTDKVISITNITQSTIQQLLGKVQSKQLELPLGNNLYLFVTKIGSCIFKYRCNYNGKRTWITLGQYEGKDRAGKILGLSLDDARIKAIQFNVQIKEDVNPKEELERDKKKGMTVSELVDKYFTEQLHLKRTKEDSQQQFIRAVKADIVATVGGCLVVDLDEDLIRSKIIQPKIIQGSPASARRARSNIKVLLDYAIDELKLIKYNPTILIKADRIYQERPRERYLSMSELGLLLNTVYAAPIKAQYKVAVHLIAILLPRKMDLLGATWEQVDLESGTFTIQNSKMGNDLLIRLPHQAIELFKILKYLAGTSQYIFPSRHSLDKPISHNTLNHLLQPLIVNTPISDIVIHDLRRSGATNLGELSYPVEVIEIALNHSRTGIKKVYHRSQYLEQRFEMLQDYSNRVDKLINPDLLPYGKTFYI